MSKLEEKMMCLFIGSPMPTWYEYQIPIIDAIFNMSEEEFDKEIKRREKLYKKDVKEWKSNRKKELKELDKLLKE